MVARFEELAKYKLATPMASSWKNTTPQQQAQPNELVHGDDKRSANIQMDVAKTLASWRSLTVDTKVEPIEVDEGVHEDESHSDTASTPHTSSLTGASSSDSHSNPGSHVSTSSEHDLTSLTNVSQNPLPENPSLPIEGTLSSCAAQLPPIHSISHKITSLETNPTSLIASGRTFAYLPPIKIETNEFKQEKFETNEPNSSHAVASISHIAVRTDHPIICAGARFSSFAEFETAFELWKNMNHHPFRVASSETLRQPDGTTYEVFRYRYIVYHCAHYGTPRMRGVGKRPNQNYLPCGCKAMLRLNFNYTDNALRITTLNDVHTGHEVTAENFQRISAKVRKISPSSMDSEEHSPRSSRGSNASVKLHASPSQTSQKPSPSELSYYSPKITSPIHNSPMLSKTPHQLNGGSNLAETTPTTSIQPVHASPLSSGTSLPTSNTTGGAFAPPLAQASIVSLLASISQQQQRERAAAATAFFAAHKENLLLATRNSVASNSNAQNTNTLMPLLQGMLNSNGLNPISILTNGGSGVAQPTTQSLPNEPTSLLSQFAASSQISNLLNTTSTYGLRNMSIMDYLQTLRSTEQSNNLAPVQNSSTLTNTENPVDLSQNGTSIQLSSIQTSPTQAQLMDAEKVLSTIGKHLSRCNSVEMDERLRQLLALLHSWGIFSLNHTSSNSR